MRVRRSAPFIAMFDGTCEYEHCTYSGIIDAGDECCYYDDELMHTACVRDQEES